MKYSFVVESKISLNIEVESNSLEEAVEMAQNSSVMSLCHHCSNQHKNEWSTSGELDCDPVSSELVDFYTEDDSVDIEKAKKIWE